MFKLNLNIKNNMRPANTPLRTDINNIDYTINCDSCETDR